MKKLLLVSLVISCILNAYFLVDSMNVDTEISNNLKHSVYLDKSIDIDEYYGSIHAQGVYRPLNYKDRWQEEHDIYDMYYIYLDSNKWMEDELIKSKLYVTKMSLIKNGFAQFSYLDEYDVISEGDDIVVAGDDRITFTISKDSVIISNKKGETGELVAGVIYLKASTWGELKEGNDGVSIIEF